MTGFEIVVVTFIWVDKNTREAFDNFLQYPGGQAQKKQTRWMGLQNEQRAVWTVELKWSTIQSVWDSCLGDVSVGVYAVGKAGETWC